MADPAAALATQLKNIQARTGRSLDELRALIAGCGLAKVGEQRSWVMETLGLGYGDANTLVQVARQAAAPASTAGADPLDAIYAGPKAALRPLHEALMGEIRKLGDFEVAPKQKTVSLRRKKQFALLGPATKDQLEVGLNARDLPDHPRLKKLPPGGMCAAAVRISTASEIDPTLIAWLRAAYDAAG